MIGAKPLHERSAIIGELGRYYFEGTRHLELAEIHRLDRRIRTPAQNCAQRVHHRVQVGLLLGERAVLRSHQKVIVPAVGEGEVTSGTFSPTLQRSIGFARVPAKTGDRCEVEIRGRLVAARVVRPPFVRHGKVAIAL